VNVLSLFDGMSCGQIALERLGINVDNYYASEIDKYAIKIAQKNYPDTIHVGDVTKLNAADIPNKIDLLIGGSPCQGFSFAGKQLNFDDPRSKLFFEFVRLYKELKPKYFMLENVRMKKECQDVISEYLGVEPIAINSNLVSAQNRYRLYWTNIPVVGQPIDKGIMLMDIIDNGFVDRDKSHCLDANYFKGGNLKSYFEKNRRQLVFSGKHKDNFRKLNPVECERLQTVPDNYTKGVSNTQRYKMLGNGWTVDVIAHIFKNLIGE
jgi:site-specific DNA-cytosine methylase